MTDVREWELPCGDSTLIDLDVYETLCAMGSGWHKTSKGYVRTQISGDRVSAFMRSYGYATMRDKNYRRLDALLHRLVLHTPLGMQTDHINGDRLDNRRANLRVVSASGNQMNRVAPTRASAGYWGVSKVSHESFSARAACGTNAMVHVGSWPTARLAALARDQYVRAIYPTATLNFPQISDYTELGGLQIKAARNKYLGIYYEKRRNRWLVYCCGRAQQKYIKSFTTEELARSAQLANTTKLCGKCRSTVVPVL